MSKPDFEYQSKKAYGLYDEADAAAALPREWHEVKRLPDGYLPEVSDSIQLTGEIPDGDGGVMEIANPPSPDRLRAIKDRVSRGYGLGWYFLPREDRYRHGPGLTGDEVHGDITSGRFVEDSKHVTFIYGFYTQNVDKYYQLYRLSGDPYYVDQIVKYADGVEWLLKNRPQQLLPAERRSEPLLDPMAEIPHEPAALANFWPHANAARLLLEEAIKNKASRDDERVKKARQFLATANGFMASQIIADYRVHYENPRPDRKPPIFTKGPNTRRIRAEFDLPPRAAQITEYTPWNQTFFYFATLTATAKAMENLQEICGEDPETAERIALYRRIVRAGMDTLQRENICVVRKGVPYFFHMHTPLRDRESQMRLGFPMFGAEDNARSGSGAINLPYIWEAGAEFGVSVALLAGYANTMVLTLEDPSTTRKNGEPWPRNHLDSPWYLAASGRRDSPASRLGDKYYHLMAFSPRIVAANRPYSRRDPVWEDEDNLRRLHAGHLYRVWRRRCDK
ncbi:MAG: hypothetical protein ACYTG0_15860 [Planctomycetota bacterium]|jgi:hypothetical protein